MKSRCLIAILLIFLSTPCFAQSSLKFQTGISYLEHVSMGPTLVLADKHYISFLYGSNCFIKTRSFSTYMLEYAFKFKNKSMNKITPALGVKGGHVIFSDDYYKWEVATMIPFFRIHYTLGSKLNLFADLGGSISFEQKVERISFGEIGKYRDLLPEIKIGTHFNLSSK